jgi:glycosyltransferase involved in cell wall biosynthesis
VFPGPTTPPMKLVIAHSHFRPGGVRRVIELALPHLVQQLGLEAEEMILVGGEAPEAAWLDNLARIIGTRCRLNLVLDPALGYLAERTSTPAVIRTEARQAIVSVLTQLDPQAAAVWLHNPGLGRNLPATREWTLACARRRIPLVFHHHDWWFDNRWQRWPELRRSGGTSLRTVAQQLLPDAPNIRHAAINQADAAPLRRFFPGRAAWLPNPAAPGTRPGADRIGAARRWLSERTGHTDPFWLLPCRLLRRKNIAEALLLARWIQPGARLVTTGGVSSADEQPYAAALAEAARRHGWPLDLSVLHAASASAPGVPDLLAASDTVVLSSLLEGFGLPYLEAAAARRPLVARHLPNIGPDLDQLGFRFPNLYDEVGIDPGLFDTRAEQLRQEERFSAWLADLPRSARPLVEPPGFLTHPEAPVGFSRLTLCAQLEVLSVDPAESLRRCRAHNPRILRWNGRRPPLTWPKSATPSLAGQTYARNLLQLARSKPGRSPHPRASEQAQADLLRGRLRAANLYPLLWTTQP